MIAQNGHIAPTLTLQDIRCLYDQSFHPSIRRSVRLHVCKEYLSIRQYKLEYPWEHAGEYAVDLTAIQRGLDGRKEE